MSCNDGRPAVRERRARWLRRTLALTYLGVLVVVPLVAVFGKVAGEGAGEFWRAISSSDAVTAYRLTAIVSITAVVLNTILGVGLAILLSRFRFPGRGVLNAICDLPVSVSPIVAGLALVLVYGPTNGWFGPGLSSAGIRIIFALPGMILATTFVSLPLVLREVMPVLQEEGIDQEQAARVLGAGTWQRFLRITLPTIRPALTYGIVLSLARAIGEFGAVRVVSGSISGAGQTQTVPLLIAERVDQLEPGSFQLALVLILVAVLAIVVVSLIGPKEKHR
jgi:sulfate transport system permease protein